MSIREDIKSILAKENITMSQLAEKRGTTVSNLSQKLRRKTIPFEEVRTITEILGYDIRFEKRK